MKHKKTSLINTESFFEKSFRFEGNKSWKLPEEAYTVEKWFIKSFQDKKCLLNKVKEQLNDVDLEAWSAHTKKRDPSSTIIKTIRYKYKPELLTQAWCKFYEILSKHDLIPDVIEHRLRSLHLCEAPGGFISALNHFLRLRRPEIKLDWHATTLNPEYEGNPLSRMIPDDRLIRHTKNKWLFGADHTGDITQFYNHEFMVEEYLKEGKAFLITADGSVNCIDDPGDQERKVEHIHYCEVMTAFALLQKGGNFVIKIFTTFEDSTISLLYLLNCSFETVTIFKPITSKSGNSEVYVICKNFHGSYSIMKILDRLFLPYKNPSRYGNTSMFDLKDINVDFLKQLESCSEFFMSKQVKTINENLKHFIEEHQGEDNRIRILHTEITNRFLQKYFVREIHLTEKLVPGCNVTNFFNKQQIDLDCEKVYYPVDDVLKLNVITGKCVEKVLYSKHCNAEDFDLAPLAEKLSQSDNLSRQITYKNCDIYDVTDFKLEDNSAFQKLLFARIHQNANTNKDVFFVKVPFLSNFLVGILYVLSSKFEKAHFFNNGAILLEKVRPEKEAHCGKLLDVIFSALTTVQSTDHFDFPVDVLEIIDTELMNAHFLRAVSFYNNNLLNKYK